MSDNRRSCPRAPLDLLFNAFHDGLPALCVATDVSEGGIGLRPVHDNRRAPAEVVEIEFQLPGADHVIAARGRVRVGESSAVVFEELPDDDRDRIRAYVAAA